MRRILDSLRSPADIKDFGREELNQLAREIRQLLIMTVSESGGHLAANLGVVELAIALHYIFDVPVDKIIWDVGHQSYVHKILTGRSQNMKTLRQYGGLSGFPRTQESLYDAFNTGHSSTSISAALGMALARDLQEKDYSVIAVIGDGALGGGMAFEALNHAGHIGHNLLVVLNDNEMSISKNVGALSRYLNRLRTAPSYSRTKEEIETALRKIPIVGPGIAQTILLFKDLIKYAVVPGTLFEELGFTYIGPVDGHNLDEMLAVLANAKKMEGPVLLHVITEKGRGYEPARQNPDVFHGVGPFDISTGKQAIKTVKTYTEIFGQYMVEKAAEDDRVVAITAAMTSGTGMDEFSRRYPERFFDVGICEQHAVTLAAGMAIQGLRPVVAVYSTFLQRAYDQLIHDVALQNLPVIMAVDRAGLVGEDGPTHHGVFDLSFIRSIPNFTVMAPSNENELLDMFYTAFQLNSPVVIRYPRGVGEGTPIIPERKFVEIGRPKLVKSGSDLLLIAIGRGVGIAKDAALLLAGSQIEAAVLDARFVKPLDIDYFMELCLSYERIVTVEDNVLAGGFGSRILELLNDCGKAQNVMRIGIADEFVEHGKVNLLLDYLNMDAESIYNTIGIRWPELWTRHGWELLKVGEN